MLVYGTTLAPIRLVTCPCGCTRRDVQAGDGRARDTRPGTAPARAPNWAAGARFEYVSLVEVRKQLGDMPRAKVEAALRQLIYDEHVWL